MMTYSIKQIAELTNLTPYTLRYYDKEGLLPSIGRTDTGMRRFSDSDLEWLGMICCLKNTGMSIREIRRFVELSREGDETLKTRFDMLVEHKKTVETEIARMEKHLEKVTRKIALYSAKYAEYCAKQTQGK